ncbi:MAG TPA: radical SAM protein [Candidatus Binataceae bacterium]|nr:radical SAM protein [Candidatus Binataceae bacterium]
MAKVALIRPPALMPEGRVGTWVITPPIATAYLAGSLRAAGHKPVVVDAMGEAPFHRTVCFDNRAVAVGLPIDEIVARIPSDTEVIGVSCMFSQDWPYLRRILEAIRRRFPKTLIVAGGEHITALPLYTLETCSEIDLCVLGEGEEAIVEIADRVNAQRDLADLKGIAVRLDGRPVLTSPRTRIRNVDAIPPPAWDLTPVDTYLDARFSFGVGNRRTIPIVATRGCPYQCTFCSNPTMWTTRWYARDPSAVLDEIQGYIDRFGVTNIDFYDLTAVVKRDWILSFCRQIEERGMKFTWQLPSGTRSEALDSEVCQALYRSGCCNLTYAPESGSPAVLERIKKRVHLDKLLSSIRAAEIAGIVTSATIIFGFPDQSRWECWQTVAFMARMALAGVYDVHAFIFIPYPGSELFNRLRESGELAKLDEEYFLSLLSMFALATPVSRCLKISNRELGALRFLGLLTFYGVQYTRRPWRLARLFYNIVSKRQESYLDKTLGDLIQRKLTARTASMDSLQARQV